MKKKLTSVSRPCVPITFRVVKHDNQLVFVLPWFPFPFVAPSMFKAQVSKDFWKRACVPGSFSWGHDGWEVSWEGATPDNPGYWALSLSLFLGCTPQDSLGTDIRRFPLSFPQMSYISQVFWHTRRFIKTEGVTFLVVSYKTFCTARCSKRRDTFSFDIKESKVWLQQVTAVSKVFS